MMNDDMNKLLRGNTLCSDGDAHNRLRRDVRVACVDDLRFRLVHAATEMVEEHLFGQWCAKLSYYGAFSLKR
jgi:hypothetical protein